MFRLVSGWCWGVGFQSVSGITDIYRARFSITLLPLHTPPYSINAVGVDIAPFSAMPNEVGVSVCVRGGFRVRVRVRVRMKVRVKVRVA